MMISAADPIYRGDLVDLVASLRSRIQPDDRAFEDDDLPGVQLTVALDAAGGPWAFQTGDNSYTGGCYGYRHWAVVGVYEHTDPWRAADDLIEQLADLLVEAELDG